MSDSFTGAPGDCPDGTQAAARYADAVHLPGAGGVADAEPVRHVGASPRAEVFGRQPG
ncbi:hypothetical protein ACWGQT_28260 [Streptomyces yangpuensis]